MRAAEARYLRRFGIDSVPGVAFDGSSISIAAQVLARRSAHALIADAFLWISIAGLLAACLAAIAARRCTRSLGTSWKKFARRAKRRSSLPKFSNTMKAWRLASRCS